MNLNLNKVKAKKQNFKILNSKMNNNNNQNGKIIEKFIIINNELIPKEKGIKELEIVLKKTKTNPNNTRRQKSNNIFKLKKINSLKETQNNEPYLKPKFQIKNKNCFSIKNNNIRNNTNNNNANDEIKNIYLNFFKVYYDENGKKIKIIKNKNNYKENNSKEIILTQNNKKYHQKIIRRNNEHLKKNYTTEFLNTKNKYEYNNKDSAIKKKYMYPETPSQSTTTDNKSNAKNRNTINKDEINTNYNKYDLLYKKEYDISEYNNSIKKNIYYENLPLFLKRKKNLKKKEKRNINNKNIAKRLKFINDEKLPLYNQSFNKIKKIDNEQNQNQKQNQKQNQNQNQNQSQNLLNAKCNYRKLNVNHNKKIQLNTIKKLNPKNDTQKINYFRNDISNLTLNMTFEQKNASTENPNLSNIYITSFNNENTKKDNNNQKVNQNKIRNVNIDNKEFKGRHSLAIHGNYILFNFNKEFKCITYS